MQTLFWLIVGLFFAGLTLNTLHYLFYAVLGRLGRADDVPPTPHPFGGFRRIAVLVPAYKEDAVILESVRANLRQDYPTDRFQLIVIADQFQPHTLDALAQIAQTAPVRVLPVSFEVSTVTKAINAALASISPAEFDIVMVSDADNHLATDFLSRVNAAFAAGWRAVQGHRVAKNTTGSVAVLDAVSEEINNHITRRGYRVAGLSATIIGSGMAVETGLMQEAMSNLTTVGGFDKELAMKLAIDGHKIGYLEEAFVYDEKVAKRAVFQHQRTRWIAAQYQFVADYFRPGMQNLLAGRWLSGIKLVQEMAVPKVLLLAILLLTTFVCALVGNVPTLLCSGTLLLLLGLSMALSIPAYLWQRLSLRDIGMVFALMLSFGKAAFNIRKAFKSFMHTPHNA
jgi:1,2-diacylglycerol 3-beta-glucosyltransferase